MEFLEKFNKLTNNKYEYIRVKNVNIQKKPPVVEVNLLVPYEILDKFLQDEDKSNIENAIVEILPKSMNVVVNYNKSYVDVDIVKKYVLDFFKEKHPTIFIESSEIDVNIQNDIVFITINLKSMFYDYFKQYDLQDKVSEYMLSKFCNPIKLEIKDSKKSFDFDVDLATEESVTMISRKIRTSNHQKIIGRDISDRPKYIVDSKEKEDYAVYAGKVTEFKRNESKKTGNSYYVFKISDTTGVLTCKAFTKYQGEGEYDKIAVDDTIIVKGKKELDTFLHDSVLLVRDVSKCEIDYSSIVLKEELKNAPLMYSVVQPQQYEDFVQDSLFDDKSSRAVPEFLKGKTFVVFDFETTGLEVTDEVIELGAVKLQDGVITQSFSTFVNPHIPIPEKITELTSIKDSDVQNAPDMKDVVADFYKFSENCILVGQNVGFDKKFLDRYAKENGYFFANKVMDTLEIAKKSIICKNYKLGTLCDYFGISLEGAHRAVNDCEATAKLFVELIRLGKFWLMWIYLIFS